MKPVKEKRGQPFFVGERVVSQKFPKGAGEPCIKSACAGRARDSISPAISKSLAPPPSTVRSKRTFTPKAIHGEK